MFLILLMYFCIASAFTIGKAALDYSDPMFLIGVRMSVAGLILLGYQYFVAKKGWRFEKKDWPLFAQIAIIGVFVSYGLEFWAMKHHVSSVKACLFFNFSPFATALMAYFMINESLSAKKWLGLIIGFFGMFPIILTDVGKEGVFGAWGMLSLPEVALLAGVISFAHSWIVFKKLVSERGYTPFMVNGVSILGGGVLSLISSFLLEGFPPIIEQSNTAHVSPLYELLVGHLGEQLAALTVFSLYTGLLIFVANIFAYNLYGYLLRSYTTTFLSFAGFTTALFGIALGWFFRGEAVTWHFLVSIIFVFLGLYIFYKDELRIIV